MELCNTVATLGLACTDGRYLQIQHCPPIWVPHRSLQTARIPLHSQVGTVPPSGSGIDGPEEGAHWYPQLHPIHLQIRREGWGSQADAHGIVVVWEGAGAGRQMRRHVRLCACGSRDGRRDRQGVRRGRFVPCHVLREEEEDEHLRSCLLSSSCL